MSKKMKLIGTAMSDQYGPSVAALSLCTEVFPSTS